jgi:hypothetical protein
MADVQALLSLVLQGWQSNQGLPAQSADEQLLSEDTTEVQRRWLETYCRLWDINQDMEPKNGN